MPVHFEKYRDIDGNVNVPLTFDDAVDFLYQSMDDLEKEILREYGPYMFHHGFGTAMRNHWQLWTETSLTQDTIQRFGGQLGDDVSGHILKELASRVGWKPEAQTG